MGRHRELGQRPAQLRVEDAALGREVRYAGEMTPGRPKPVALATAKVPARSKPSNYPEPFASRMAGREKRQLGDQFGLTNFGVNLTRLAPNAVSALRHAHSKQDEFVYVLQVDLRCTPTKGEPSSLPACAQASRLARVTDIA